MKTISSFINDGIASWDNGPSEDCNATIAYPTWMLSPSLNLSSAFHTHTWMNSLYPLNEISSLSTQFVSHTLTLSVSLSHCVSDSLTSSHIMSHPLT